MKRTTVVTLVTIALACVVLPHSAAAQGSPDFKGLSHFIIETVVPDNTCGLTQDDVEAHVRKVVVESRMILEPPLAVKMPTEYLTLIEAKLTLFPDCSAIYVSLDAETPARLEITSRFVGGVTFWQRGTILKGVGGMRSRVLSAIDDLSKKLVVEWSSANPR